MHEARHTAITDFLRRSGNLKLAQMLAGHADIGTTANIYAHLDTTDLETCLPEIPICREYGGGGNRTRVRSRTGKSIYKRSLRLSFARRPVRRRPTDGLALL
jgi:hypothetical protein